MAASTQGNEHKGNGSLVEQAQQEILRYITENGYRLDSVLPKEQELAGILGVSRVIVREALSSLRALGFIETKRKKGTVLVSPQIFSVLKVIFRSGLLGKDAVKDLYELRLMLEVGMADYVFGRRNATDMALLQEIVDREEKCTESEEFTALDIKFHSILYRMSQNKSLVDFQHLLNTLFVLYTPQTIENRKEDLVTHRTLLQLLKKGSADAFRSAMRFHLENQFSKQEQNLRAFESNRKHSAGIKRRGTPEKPARKRPGPDPARIRIGSQQHEFTERETK